VKQTEAPHIDTRRAEEFRSELLTRARAWIRGWTVAESPGDFGAALLDVAARFSSQVAERLDRAGEKLSLGLLDWLAIRGRAAKPARMPVVLKLADTARDPVFASKPVRLQADVDGASVVFETEADVTLLPGTLAQLVAVDTSADAYYLPPPGISSLDPLEARPDRWTLKSFAAAGATQLQLDPAVGLDPGAFIETGNNQYRVVTADGDLVTVEPGVASTAGLAQGALVTRVVEFDAFGGSAHNWQEHALYIGDKDLLNIQAAATIEVIGAAALRDATWQFFGKLPGDANTDWHDIPLDAAPAGSVLLDKPVGSIEPTKIGDGEPNRWIRARLAKVVGAAALLDVEELKLVINRGNDSIPCGDSGQSADTGSQAEGFANATPLAFTSVFYPLGREPKQFDTFYLGCADAFSKKQAKVAICFELADASTNAYSTIGRGSYFNELLASVGEDSALHLNFASSFSGSVTKFRDREPLQPPRPGANAGSQDGSAIALFNKAAWRPPMWFANNAGTEANYIAVSAGSTVWVWQEDILHKDLSGWISFGSIASGAANTQVSGLVYVEGSTPRLYAAFGGKLYSRFASMLLAGFPWQEVALTGVGASPEVVSIGPVRTPVVNSNQWDITGLVGVIIQGSKACAYSISLTGQCTQLDSNLEVQDGTIPVGITIKNSINIVLTDTYFWEKKSSKNVLVAHRLVHATSTSSVLETTPGTNGPDEIVGGTLDVAAVGTEATVVADGKKNSDSWLIRWTPFRTGGAIYSEHKLPAGVGPLGGAPTALTGYVIAPGTRGEAWMARWRPDRRFAENVTLQIGLVVDNISLLNVSDRVIIDDGNNVPPNETAIVTAYSGVSNGESLFALNPGAGVQDFGTGVLNPNLFVFRASSQRQGTNQGGNSLVVDGLDTLTDDGDWIVVFDASTVRYYKVTHRSASGVLTLSPTPALTDPSPAYTRGIPLTARIAPFFDLSNSAANLLTVDDLKGNVFDFGSTFAPPTQTGEAFKVEAGNHPRRIVQQQNWQTVPNPINPAAVAFDAAIADWVRQLGDSPTNPELIWEYWNGSNWAKLEIGTDETQDFTTTGKLKFVVPNLLAPTDVAGKNNFWIRARLISGDYGREKVNVTTVTNGDTSTQTVNRDTGDFHPPQVVNMRIRYALDTSVYPAEVRSRDSGSWRNQSDANRAPGARVEAFVPLSLLMSRLRDGVASATDDAGATGCDCELAADPVEAPGDDAAATETASASSAATGRALLLGFDTGPLGEPVNVLLLVEERSHDGFAPLTAETVIKDRFEALTAKDGTRALGESGIVSMVFPVKPGARDLFGRTLAWVRLWPSRIDANAQWRPVLRGAYVNAAWASATETMTREPLGSSDGRPNLTVRVARPPLLQDTLELRVREPLDEEERQAMLDADLTDNPDRRSVKYDIPDMPGNWVLWKQVPDPSDYGPHERVYALDEALGEIQFGDGTHGMIPPIGRDAVVAFTYQRTEPSADGGDSVPANSVQARSKLNLVTPVESVESATAADHAAGGAPPESVERVQRFGNARLRHRGRALTLADFEDLALESSPDIVQARAFASAGGVRLVVVMGGAKPLPDAAQRRALLRELQAAASPPVAEHGSLSIEGARVRRVRLRLTLLVANLDDTGAVANSATRALSAFFDSSTGGVDGIGWPLGTAPADDDISFALGHLPGLEGIEGVELQEIDDEGWARVWQPIVRSDELVLLDDDPVRFNFLSLDVEA
jgi:hypothetical protein